MISGILVFFSFLGILDSLYLTWEHVSGAIPPCGVGIFADCGKVLKSPYAMVFGIPLSVYGLGFYSLECFLALWSFKSFLAKKFLTITTAFGFLFSLYLVSLMVFVIQALCLYCLLSALISTVLFFIVQIVFWRARKAVIVDVLSVVYPRFIRPILFRIDSEAIHVATVKFSGFIGSVPLLRWIVSFCLSYRDKHLEQTLAGIRFPAPVGLAAGYDYEADLTEISGALGFGFHTIGTITNRPYHGNPAPRLGRLPKSQSILVNKGYKNRGADETIKKLCGKHCSIPIGISIGVTNDPSLTTLQKVIADIQECFKKFEAAHLRHSYYELNISCPNLLVGVSLETPQNLDTLLRMIDRLKLSRPVFIKMPIEKSDAVYKQMLDVILRHKIAGVIIGNLSKDRKNPALNQEEVSRYPVGNFSGKPTWESSNHLISLTRRYAKNKLIIIGCGGIFSPEDAKEKLRCGADLVQLITGMIYQGPQLASSICQHIASDTRI